MIQETIVYCYKYKSMDIIDSNQLHVALNTAENIFNDIIIISEKIKNNSENIEQLINSIQKINNDISNLFRLFGTDSINSLLTICFGSSYIKNEISQDNRLINIFNLINIVH